ncbi:acyl-CoA dehydrogenase family protein [Luteimicrobium xylanilyticum]|uniref:Acyl-CoA dehydrogenase AidB n=1 Tax=Luteimicrobium xylanilyticum TaxID=1133546 RepID=A0A5P9QE59_9MICO|nr:acyl-CoA dehydrogenase family protein [Luteimicrobium xylanilyticum]QFU99751.1 Putative acyl-CoA dehydrogenase AidB [Luteimicrobium xylanilyticum]
MTQPRPHVTHEVTNQVPPREGVDEYADFPVLRRAVHALGGAWGDDRLHDVGRLVGSAAFQADAERANRVNPELRAFDRWGRRLDEVDYDPAYHRVLGAAVAHGAHTSAWAEPRPGANVVRAAVFSLFAQVEPGHACPVSMSHAAVPSLAHAPALADVWVPRLLSREYDGGLVPFGDGPDRKRGALFGMAMTEKQGGSDVRAGTTLARPAVGDGGGLAPDDPGAPYLLTGHKWFCSAPMSDAFLVLARAARRTSSGEERPADDVSCFLVPRVLDDGTRNVLRIQRLKDKLGNRSNASSEIELDGTVGYLVGEPGRGVRTIIEMVARTREDCVHGTAAGMRQGVAEALWHARHRTAFGARLVDQPAMTAVLADLALESEAATLTSLRLAAAFDDVTTGDGDGAAARGFSRLATAVAKYWVCKRGPAHAYEAMECLGGNGYTEAFPLARRYREQPVMAIWEGSGNVIALDVLRALARDPESFEAFDAEVSRATGASAVLDRHLVRTRRLVAGVARDPGTAPAQARRLVEALALGLQASLMVRFASDASADAFVVARLGEDRALGYGVLPSGADLGAVLADHAG